MPAADFVVRAIVADASKRAVFATLKRSRETPVLAQEFAK